MSRTEERLTATRELEPLPVTDAERSWLGALMGKYRRQLLKKRPAVESSVLRLNPELPDYRLWVRRLGWIDINLAYCEIMAERLGLDMEQPFKPFDAEDAL